MASQNVQGYAASDYDLQHYYNLSGSLLSRIYIYIYIYIYITREAMNCRDTSCKTHHKDIGSFYDIIINTLKTTAKKMYSSKKEF